ncbi:MAG TPA: hypothetical protein ENK18_08160 [Deltaproteobacteria bacterium]|nr:hypothetical protein [Deltaproteobacteria bacterium]
MSYTDFARRLLASGVVPDPWCDGRPRFRPEPVVLSAERARAIEAAGVAAVELHQAAFELCEDDPGLIDSFLCLTPVQRLMWQASLPWWHGIARADVFETEDGQIKVCELNSDTPTGQPEAVVLGRLAVEDHPGRIDPTARLQEHFVSCVEGYARTVVDPEHPRVIGLIYPTELTEDLHMVQLMHQWLEATGWPVVLGSPFNLGRDASGAVTLMGERITVAFRHYKTDWWSERLPAWDDEDPFDDPLPLAAELDLLLSAQHARRCVILNPFGSVLTQNKRTMALLWELQARLSPEHRELLHRYIPETRRLDAVHPEQIVAEREQWVLKSDYGAEGEEVVVGRHTEPGEWALAIEHAIPERFVVQRCFVPARDPDGWSLNLGPWVVAGRSAGIYGRLQRGPTDGEALSVAVLVEPGPGVE